MSKAKNPPRWALGGGGSGAKNKHDDRTGLWLTEAGKLIESADTYRPLTGGIMITLLVNNNIGLWFGVCSAPAPLRSQHDQCAIGRFEEHDV